MTGKDWADIFFGLLVAGFIIGTIAALKGWW